MSEFDPNPSGLRVAAASRDTGKDLARRIADLLDSPSSSDASIGASAILCDGDETCVRIANNPDLGACGLVNRSAAELGVDQVIGAPFRDPPEKS